MQATGDQGHWVPSSVRGEAMLSNGCGTVSGRRIVARALHRLRTESGQSEEDAAACLDCPVARLQRIEAGAATIRVSEVRALLDLYGVRGEHRETILDQARKARDRCWWRPYTDLLGDDFETVLVYEDDASLIRTYQPSLVPGLLQTERYAWELIGTQSDLPLSSVRRRAELRALRRQVVYRDDGARLVVILDEAVLQRTVGSPKVMAEQYAHLADLADVPGVSIRVLPFSAGPQQGMGAGFHIYGFGGEERPVVELELLDRVRFTAESDQVSCYTSAFERAVRCALPADRSRTLLRNLATAGG